MNKEQIKIKLFKEVSIEYKDNKFVLSKIMGKKLINLFEYLVLNSNRQVSNSEIQENLWPENADAKEVIKYSVFRFRKAVNEIKELKEIDLIDTKDDGYMLSNKYKYEIDVDKLGDFYTKNINNRKITDEKYEEALKIIDLYTGKLYLSNNPPLALSLQAEELSSQYVNLLSLISEYLLSKADYKKVIEINKKAIKIEPFYEKIQYYYIKGLIGINDYHKALKYYDEVQEKFVTEIGIGLSNKFNDLYLDIRKKDDNDSSNNKTLQQIIDDVEANITNKGGFYCSYSTFIQLYETRLKNAKRDRKHCFLVLFTLNKTKKISEAIKMSNKLVEIIGESIRAADIYTKISDSQILMLMSSRNIDGVYKIIDRISPKFYKKYSNKKYRLNYEVRQVELSK